MYKANPVNDYCNRHGILAGQLFFRAKRCHLGHRDLTLEEQKEACRELAAYQVHGTIPDYVARYAEHN